MTARQVLHVASEIAPLIKTGGLADVAGALPRAQRALGADARLLIPGYAPVMEQLNSLGAFKTSDASQTITVGPAFGAARVRLLQTTVPDTNLPLIVLDAPWFFARQGNPYLDSTGQMWSDNHRRFALLSWVGAQIAAGQLIPDWQPDVLHSHDWHAAPALAYLSEQPASPVRRILTIHNLAFQGLFPMVQATDLSLPLHWLSPQWMEFHGELSFLKAGIVAAHKITTVSPNYAKEILQPANGHGLHGLLRQRSADLIGILNGIDNSTWDPQNDPALTASYNTHSIADKHRNKTSLRRELKLDGVDEAPNAANAVPIIAAVSRLSAQKGLDLLLDEASNILATGCQLVVLGSGEPQLEQAFESLAAKHPGKVSVSINFDEALAHRIFGGSDFVLVPSQFEPCGLTQMYGLRYGTVPIVRRVGGLADTIIDELDTAKAENANGFVFDDPKQLMPTIIRAITTFRNSKRWHQLVTVGMNTDHNWHGPAQTYLDAYGSTTTTRSKKS